MPIFEIEKDGELFEVEGPDMQSVAKAMSSFGPKPEEEASVSGFIGNVGSDIYDIGAGLATAVTSPIETAQAIAENPSALVQPYVDQVSDPAGYAYEHPVSSLLNFSGAAGLARGALVKGGMAAKSAAALKASKVADKASRYTDPFLAASKFAGKAYKGATQKVALPFAGSMSATANAPAKAFAAGREGAYEGAKALANQKLGTSFKTAAPDGKEELLTGHMREKRPADEIDARVTKGLDEAYTEAQGRIDALYQPMKADRTPMWTFDLELPNIMDKARKEAYHSGGVPYSKTTDRVFKEIERTITDWIKPPADILKARRLGQGSLLAKDILKNDKIVRDFGGDPAKMTADDFFASWVDKRRSFEGMDGLKQTLSKVYQGYVARGGAPDARAGKVAAEVVHDLQAVIKKETSARHGDSYMQGQKIWSDRLNQIKNFNQTFGFSRDTRTRRITAINRDGVFANFGNRLKELEELQGVAPSLRNLEYIAAGGSMKTFMPRNLLQGTASALGLGYLANPLYGAAVLASHMPRVVGEGALALGRAEGWIVKPVVAIAKAINSSSKAKKAGVTAQGLARGGAQVAAQAGKGVNQLEDTKEQFRNALIEQTKKTGYNIHPTVLNRAVDSLLSEDPDEFMRGLKTVSGHTRLMKLITQIGEGTKGER